MLRSKDRLAAFSDAVLAIVMTIIVLGIDVPDPLTPQTLLALWPQLLAYAVSFLWLGAMWVNQHNHWAEISWVGPRTVWADLIMLFFSSLFPFATRMVAENFLSPLAQVSYGVVILLVTMANVLLYRLAARDNPQQIASSSVLGSNARLAFDFGAKLIGLALSATAFPPAVTCATLATLLFIVIPPQLRED